MSEDLLIGGGGSGLLAILYYIYVVMSKSATITLVRCLDGTHIAKVRYGLRTTRCVSGKYSWSYRHAYNYDTAELALAAAKSALSQHGCPADITLRVIYVAQEVKD